jgi:hypothetical protein
LHVPADEVAVAAFEQAPTQAQPWLCGDRKPPLSIADLGLQGEVRLLADDPYLDGGSQEFVLSDNAGHYFVFCTSNPEATEPAFLLGTKHFTEPQICRVAIGSASYQFLFDLIWSFAENPRYQLTPEERGQLRLACGASKEKFDLMLKKPNQALPHP